MPKTKTTTEAKRCSKCKCYSCMCHDRQTTPKVAIPLPTGWELKTTKVKPCGKCGGIEAHAGSDKDTWMCAECGLVRQET